MPIALTSMEQLLPFPTAEELTTKKTEGLVSVTPGTTVLTALGLMAEKHIGFLPVIENGALLGVLSERDCARRVVLRQLAAGTTTVREIMSTHVYSVLPQTRIHECVMLMHDRNIRHLPVIPARPYSEIIARASACSMREFPPGLREDGFKSAANDASQMRGSTFGRKQ